MAAAVMTALVFCENGRRAAIGQNGDTRAYLYSDGDLILLTEDQDAVHMDMEEGKLTPEAVEGLGGLLTGLVLVMMVRLGLTLNYVAYLVGDFVKDSLPSQKNGNYVSAVATFRF